MAMRSYLALLSLSIRAKAAEEAVLPPGCENLTQVPVGAGLPIVFDGGIKIGGVPDDPYPRDYRKCLRGAPAPLVVQRVAGLDGVRLWSDRADGFEFVDSTCFRVPGEIARIYECSDRTIVPKGKKNILQVPDAIADAGFSIQAACCSHVTILPGFRNLGIIALSASTVRASGMNTTYVTAEHDSTVILHDEEGVGEVTAFSGAHVQINGTVEDVTLAWGSLSNGRPGAASVRGNVNEAWFHPDGGFALRINGGEGTGCANVSLTQGWQARRNCVDDPGYAVPEFTETGCSDEEAVCSGAPARLGKSMIWLWPVTAIFFVFSFAWAAA